MHFLDCDKPDGRRMTLYGRAPVILHGAVPSPFPEALVPNPHLRWHPLRGEWITYAAYRQGRVFQSPSDADPFAVTSDAANPTELPAGIYDIAVFDNRFPSLTQSAHDAPPSTVPTAAASGRCEVIVYAQDPKTALGRLPLPHIELLMEVWADRTARAAVDPNIRYVLPFESRGAEMGATVAHPHGQLYAYPFVPPVPARMLESELAFYREHERTLLGSLIGKELQSGARMLYEGPHAVAFVPACARYPYEVWVGPIEAVSGLPQLSQAQRSDLARALKTVLLKYEYLWEKPFPYLMAWYQAPVDSVAHPETHLHAELSGPYRARDRLKMPGGTELAAGLFVMDVLPEEKARELQQIQVDLD